MRAGRGEAAGGGPGSVGRQGVGGRGGVGPGCAGREQQDAL